MPTLGAGGALLSLWAPWYSFQIPQELLNRAAAVAGQFGILGPAIQQYTQEARAMGPYHLTAWDVFHQIDVILAVVAAVAASFALLALTGRGTGTGKLVALAGLIVVLLAGYRVIDPPGPAGLLHVIWGAYAALACGVVTILGGLLTARAEDRAGAVDASGILAAGAGRRRGMGGGRIGPTADRLLTGPSSTARATRTISAHQISAGAARFKGDRRSLAQRDRSPPTHH